MEDESNVWLRDMFQIVTNMLPFTCSYNIENGYGSYHVRMVLLWNYIHCF